MILILVTSLFLSIAAWSMCGEAWRMLTWRATEGKITAVHRPDPYAVTDEDRHGWLDYSYTAGEQPCTGRYPPKYKIQMPRLGYPLLRDPPGVGDAITCYVNPAKPSDSMMVPRVDPMPWGFAAFTLPLFSLGWMLVKRPNAMNLRRVGNDGMRLIDGSATWVVYILVSVVAAFGLMVGLPYLSWQTGQVIGAGMTLGVLPGVAWGVYRLTTNRSSPVSRQMRDRRKRAMVFGAAALFWWAIIGVFVVDSVMTAVQYVHAQPTYQPITATITRAGIREVQSGGGRRHSHTSYTPVIVYTYHVGKTDYESDRLTVGLFDTTFRHHEAEQWITRYPAGSQTTVYFDPARPKYAVLSLKLPRERWLEMGMMTPFVGLGVWLVVMTIRAARVCFRDPGSS